MRLIRLLFCVSLAAYGLEPAAWGEQEISGPAIACDEPTYYFGERVNTGEVVHTFVIRNVGTAPLEIRNVRATCGCTATSLSKKMLDPGESVGVEAKLDLRGRQGRQYKTIFVESNDPRTPTLTLAFEGIAKAEFDVQPRQIFFGRIGVQAQVTGVVEIASASGQPLRVRRVETGNPMLAAEVEEDQAGLRIAIKTLPPLVKGPFQARVQVETDHPTQPITEIIVSGFVVGDVSYAPSELVLQEQPDASVVRYVLMRSETGQPFEIHEVKVPQPEMETSVQPTGTGAYRIEIRNIRPTAELNGKGVHILTSLPESKDIVIPFRIVPSKGT